MKAVVESYCVPYDPSWDVYDDARSGDVMVERYGPTDRWIIRMRRDSGWLRRAAIGWRERNPEAPLSTPDDQLHAAPPARREIGRMFDHPAMNSSRTDAWNDDHSFTLAEALYVVGAEAP